MASKRKAKGEPGVYRTKDPKLCVECKWFQEDKEGRHRHTCMHRLAQHISGPYRYQTEDMRRDADAKYIPDPNRPISLSRMAIVYMGDGQCGPEGRLWEAKPPEPEPKPEPEMPTFQGHEPAEPGSVVRLKGATGWKVRRRPWWREWL